MASRPTRKRKSDDVGETLAATSIDQTPAKKRRVSPHPSRHSHKTIEASATTVRSNCNGSPHSGPRNLLTASLRSPTTSAVVPRTQKKPADEKRRRKYRARPPNSFQEKLHRARTQRMIVINRSRHRRPHPSEDIDIVGTTGNVYTVTIDHVPSCTCPDSLKGNECKHKVYALHTVLKAPEHLQYQLALLTAELLEIFENAPPLPNEVAAADDGEYAGEGKRKCTDVECPICYMDLDPASNELVWCKAQCGHNVHRSCFDQWARSQSGQQLRCVYCRTPWETDVSGTNEARAVLRGAAVGADGYLNVADQFGLSRTRDASTYSTWGPWGTRRF